MDHQEAAMEQAVGPLSGIRVVEAATFLSGPLAAQALADLGAEVTKVEPPEGDAMRRFGRSVDGLSVLWVAANRSKRTVVADLAQPAGRQVLDQLLGAADVLITNWRPGVAERLGLEPSRLRASWPGLVWCRISGFGQTGPRALEPAFDGVIQAASGAMPVQGASAVPPAAGEERPEMVKGFPADKVTAGYATQAILAALVQRSRTGEGCVVDLAMLDAVAHFNFVDLLAERALPGDDGEGDGISRQLTGVRAVRTADGWIVLAPARARQMRSAAEVAGHPEWLEELRHADPAEVTARFFDLLGAVTPSRPTAAWLDAFRGADVPVAEVLDPDGHLADPQVAHNQIYAEGEHPTLGRHRWARYPSRWSAG